MSLAQPHVGRRVGRRLKSPVVQLLVSLAGMAGGAWLIGMWAVGVVVVIGSLLVAVDAVLRDASTNDMTEHQSALERYWRER